MSLLRVYLAISEKSEYLSLVKLLISLSGVEENLMKDTGVQHVTGVLCTLGENFVTVTM